MTQRYQIDPEQLPDELLVDLIADGDADAFALMTNRYGGQMYSVALRYTRNATDASDVVQEALLTIWQKIEDLQDAKALRPWIMRVTATKAIDTVRSRKPVADLDEIAELPTETATPEKLAVQSDGISQLEKALAELPEDQAQVWVLRNGAGLSYQEIAEELEVSVSTVRGRLARAKATLMEAMSQWQ